MVTVAIRAKNGTQRNNQRVSKKEKEYKGARKKKTSSIDLLKAVLSLMPGENVKEKRIAQRERNTINRRNKEKRLLRLEDPSGTGKS